MFILGPSKFAEDSLAYQLREAFKRIEVKHIPMKCEDKADIKTLSADLY
jgi:hypothetical protein